MILIAATMNSTWTFKRKCGACRCSVELLCTYTFLLSFSNLTQKLKQKLCLQNNISQCLFHPETHLHATTSFNNLFQFAHLPQRDSSEPVFRRNNGALEIHCKYAPHHHSLSGLITTLPHCDALTFRSYINIYVVKFLHYGFMAMTRPWKLPALFLRCKSFSVDSEKQLETILHIDTH